MDGVDGVVAERTATALRAAFDTGDVGALAPLLAGDVRWHGAGPGGCHSAAEALTRFRAALDSGSRFRLTGLRRAGRRLLLHVAVDPEGDAVHLLLSLDDGGRIARILDYADPAQAEADLAPPAPAPAPVPIGRAVPFVSVRDVSASARFYALLGFSVAADHRVDGRPVWVSLRSGRAELMLAESAEPIDPARQGVLFYLYSDDLAALREHLRAHGATPSEIADGSPGPRRELRVDDPDGYCLMIAHIGAEPKGSGVTSDDEQALTRPIGWWLKEADTRLDAAFDTALVGLGIDRRAWQVLASISRDSMQRTELVDALAPFDQPVVIHAVLDQLRDRGWIEESAGSVVLTDAGRGQHAVATPRVDRVRERIAAALPRDDYVTLVGLLARLVAALPPA